MVKFHPSVAARMEKVGRQYQKIAFATIDIQKEILQFYDDLNAQALLNQQQNNLQLELEKEKKLSLEQLDARMEKLTHMAQTSTKFVPDFKTLTFATKPYVDGILAFRDFLMKEMQKLANNVNSEEKSEAIMSHIEKKFTPIPNDFMICRNTLDTCLKHLQEIKRMYAEVD
jgi:hypothetical protein